MTEKQPVQPPPEHWDDETAARLIGATVLIGLTYELPNGEVDRQEQMFGMVVAADQQNGIVVELEGTRLGTSYSLPPQTSTFVPAPRGTYRLRSTGEEIVDPDYTCTWTVTPGRR